MGASIYPSWMAGGRKPTRLKSGGRWETARNMATIPAWDAAEADALYDLLEREVIPEFYARDENGIPTAWVSSGCGKAWRG